MSLSGVIQKSALLYRSGFMNFFLYIFNAVKCTKPKFIYFLFFWNTHNYTSTNQYKHTNSYSRIYLFW